MFRPPKVRKWARIAVLRDGTPTCQYRLDKEGRLVDKMPRGARRTGLTPKGSSCAPTHRIARVHLPPPPPADIGDCLHQTIGLSGDELELGPLYGTNFFVADASYGFGGGWLWEWPNS
jgi:hypothetical protein